MNQLASTHSVPRIPPDLSLPAGKRDWQATWRRQDYLELVAVREAVPAARHHVRAVLRQWQARELACEAEQVTAELVANAVNATQIVTWMPAPPPVRLWLLGAGSLLMVAVWDATVGVPVRRMPAEDEVSGRGLLIVDDFAAWGFYPAPRQPGGKVVWAMLPKAEARRDQRSCPRSADTSELRNEK